MTRHVLVLGPSRVPSPTAQADRPSLFGSASLPGGEGDPREVGPECVGPSALKGEGRWASDRERKRACYPRAPSEPGARAERTQPPSFVPKYATLCEARGVARSSDRMLDGGPSPDRIVKEQQISLRFRALARSQSAPGHLLTPGGPPGPTRDPAPARCRPEKDGTGRPDPPSSMASEHERRPDRWRDDATARRSDGTTPSAARGRSPSSTMASCWGDSSGGRARRPRRRSRRWSAGTGRWSWASAGASSATSTRPRMRSRRRSSSSAAARRACATATGWADGSAARPGGSPSAPGAGIVAPVSSRELRSDRLDALRAPAGADLVAIEAAATVRAEVDRLPEPDRLLMRLTYWQGKTYEEAAASLSWPIGTVRSRLSRARERLRGRLARLGLAPASAAIAAAVTGERSAASATTLPEGVDPTDRRAAAAGCRRPSRPGWSRFLVAAGWSRGRSRR